MYWELTESENASGRKSLDQLHKCGSTFFLLMLHVLAVQWRKMVALVDAVFLCMFTVLHIILWKTEKQKEPKNLKGKVWIL